MLEYIVSKITMNWLFLASTEINQPKSDIEIEMDVTCNQFPSGEYHGIHY